MKFIDGGVCAALGFTAAGIHCGIRKNKNKFDLALIKSSCRAASAAVYTQNLVKGAPIEVTRKHLADGYAQVAICNSGNANTCNANGVEIATAMAKLAAAHNAVAEEDVIVASTGVIGQPLDITPIANGMEKLTKSLGANSKDAANAIMTTDTVLKEFAVEFEIGGHTCRLGGIAKGSGMIHPNMATMLVFLTTDVAITPEMLSLALKNDTADSFNMISVDGDTSTNDMCCIMANGEAKNPIIDSEGEAYDIFKSALNAVTVTLCRAIAKDGEGATKLLICTVSGAETKDIARISAKSVICSSLFKAAMFGADANWGRVLCALGYAGADIDVNKIDVLFRSAAGEIAVCKNGAGVDFSEELASKILRKDEIEILISLGSGAYSATAWGCDLTYDYVRINGDYRS